jgi:hypothetical protein
LVRPLYNKKALGSISLVGFEVSAISEQLVTYLNNYLGGAQKQFSLLKQSMITTTTKNSDRLRTFTPLGSRELVSVAAEQHGRLRRQQGYSAAMMVEESRMLQVSIFETLQRNLANIDFSILLNAVMTIADEVDSQLSQAMDSYVDESLLEAAPL